MYLQYIMLKYVPQTDKVGCKAFVWTNQMQHAFEQMKSMIVVAILLQYPDQNFPFKLYTNNSGYQLGA